MAKDQKGTEKVQEDAQKDDSPVFGIEKIYLKDASLEIPNSPKIFLSQEQPTISIELQNRATSIDEGVYEAVVAVTVTSKIKDQVAFLVEVAQAGIFRIMNVPEDNIPVILGVSLPNILYPYAREAVSSLLLRAGFPPVLLNPINFEALYAQQLEQQNAENAKTN